MHKPIKTSVNFWIIVELFHKPLVLHGVPWLLRQRQEAEEDPLVEATEVMVLTVRQALSNLIVTYPKVI